MLKKFCGNFHDIHNFTKIFSKYNVSRKYEVGVLAAHLELPVPGEVVAVEAGVELQPLPRHAPGHALETPVGQSGH